MRIRCNSSNRNFRDREITIKKLEKFLESDRVVTLFGEKEDVYAGTAAGRYNYDIPFGYLIRQQWVNKDDTLLIIYIEGFDRIEKEFKTIEELILFMKEFVMTGFKDYETK